MTTRATYVLIAILVILGLGVFLFTRGGDNSPLNPGGQNSTTTPGGNNTGTPATSTPTTNNLIRVTSPQPNASVRSPLTITGEARGNWYFEASFPVKILDADGRELGVHYAQAQGEWMTTNFVPFSSTLNFATSTTPTGTLVLQKDNPSGLPENDAEIRIPIRFAVTAPATQTRVVKLYFYNENLDKDTSGNTLCSEKGLVVVNRTIARTNTPIQDAVKELLKGPTAAERASAPNSAMPQSEFPLSGVTLNSASLTNGALTLTFNDPQNRTSGGSCRVTVLREQIEATAKQFGGVSTVNFQPSNVFQP